MTTLLAPTMAPSQKTSNALKAAPLFSGKAWQQVLARDANADGQFVYAVKSTGVYCKPSCPSRRPERKNVSFFPSPDAAESAGFRACLRCEPRSTAAKADPQAPAIERATEILRERAGQRVALEDLSTASGLGKYQLLRAFDRVLGVSPGEFAREQRRDTFRNKLRVRKTVTEAVYEAGFGSPSRVYEDTDDILGMTPSTMKEGGKGETIRWSTADSPLGKVLVAATNRGLCAVLFADTDGQAAAELRERFPQAVLRRDDGALASTLPHVVSNLSESPTASTLPLDVRATAFQIRVWNSLRRIPRGETRTYAQIAEEIGSPKSVRAVGTACGMNPLALLIPCHRVIGADGKLTGYRWGTERKRLLLDLESTAKDSIA